MIRKIEEGRESMTVGWGQKERGKRRKVEFTPAS